MQTCNKCEQSYPTTREFWYKHPYDSVGLQQTCKECINAAKRALPSPKKTSWGQMGMTEELFEQMFKQQEGRCAICGTPQHELSQRLAVDHDHTTGQIRGLLCHKCNTAIGLLKDSPSIITKAATYLLG